MTVKTRSNIAKKAEKENGETQYLAVDPDEILKLQEESKNVSACSTGLLCLLYAYSSSPSSSRFLTKGRLSGAT